MILIFVTVFILLCFSAFFSASETALTATSETQIQRMIKKKIPKAVILKNLNKQMGRVIGSVLLGNNLVNILATSLATSAFITLFQDSGIGIATAVMTTLILIFAEVMPKMLAIQNPQNVALFVSKTMSYIVKILNPVTYIIRYLAEKFWKVFGVNIKAKNAWSSPQEELRGAIDAFSSVRYEDQKNMLHSVLDLSSITVGEIMIPRNDVETISLKKDLKDIKKQILKSPYSRLPVWENTPENITGILHIKTFIKGYEQNKNLNVKDVCSDPWFVPESTTLPRQISDFRKRKQHLAIVIDEYGSIQGIITLEDILEEIVGEITDEHDRSTEEIQKEKDGSYTVEGTTAIRHINKLLNLEIPDIEISTIAGLVINESRQIPKEGQVYRFYNLELKIIKKRHNQIKTINIKPIRE
jgi:Mg2+/Co2+ transporter CorB